MCCEFSQVELKVNHSSHLRNAAKQFKSCVTPSQNLILRLQFLIPASHYKANKLEVVHIFEEMDPVNMYEVWHTVMSMGPRTNLLACVLCSSAAYVQIYSELMIFIFVYLQTTPCQNGRLATVLTVPPKLRSVEHIRTVSIMVIKAKSTSLKSRVKLLVNIMIISSTTTWC